ncbi:MAG: aminoacyl-tRNA hydrolase [Chitinophagaceae bacterium]
METYQPASFDAGFLLGKADLWPFKSTMKFLIVGLGNVGDEYAHTRHNIGFDVVGSFVQRHGAQFRIDRLAYVAEVKWKGKSFVCICPSTYMNLSGKAVKYWMDKEKVSLENILVVLDDLALPLERLRIKPSGSDAGHNGLKSIQEQLGTTEYPKLRFGIGNDYPKGMQADFVLSKWKKSEESLVQHKIVHAVDAIEIFATQGIATAMNNYNNQLFQ